MGVRAAGIFTALLITLCGAFADSALASGPVGSDPSANFSVGPLPEACDTNPTGATCINASVNYLNQARASLGQAPYDLPADFASLNPLQQALILTNEDRILYNLPPITGLTSALDQDAAAALSSDSDPQPSTSDWYGYTSNASWGDDNMVLAYEGWMYDDGPGSNNVDCTSSDPSGCWGHRHDILWQFDPGALAMGAAAGSDSSGNTSYTMLLMQGSPSYHPTYWYTWAQAVSDGAGASSGSSSAPPPSHPGADPQARGARATVRIVSVRVSGHRVSIRLTSSGGTFRCSLSRMRGGFRRSKLCAGTVTFRHLAPGGYRLRVSSGAGTASRRVFVR